MLPIWVSSEQKFREKCEHFWSYFANFFEKFRIFSLKNIFPKCEIIFPKISRKCENIFAKCEIFFENHEFYCCNNYNCSNELVEFSCSDISMFKVLLCHINNFSSFTINVWWGEFDIGSRGYILPSNKAILRKLHKLCKPSVSFKAMFEKTIKPCCTVIIPHF